MVTYKVTAYIVDQSTGFQLDTGVVENPLEVDVELKPENKISAVGQAIDEAIEQKYKKWNFRYKTHMLSIDDVLIDSQEDKQLDFFVFKGEQGRIPIDAFVVDNSCTRGKGSSPSMLFQDLTNSDAMEAIDEENAPPEVAKMQPGMSIKVKCNKCDVQQHLYPIKFSRTGTASFDLKRNRLLSSCGSEYELLGPYFKQCEFKFKGEKLENENIENYPWKTVEAGKIWKFEDNQLDPQTPSNQTVWKRLLIHAKPIATNKCQACKQICKKEDVSGNNKCGHTYHADCYNKLKKKICVVSGCNQHL